MKNLLTIIITLTFFNCWGQKKNNDKFITRKEFYQNFGKEIVSAVDVFANMRKSGLSDFSLAKFDFYFISNSKDKLERLKEFLLEHYPYEIKSIKKINTELWELNGETNELSITEDNLLYWGLDMYKRGYEFDSRLDGYGAPFDPKNQNFPDFAKEKEESYFNKGVECYNARNLSGAIHNWTICIEINPGNPNSYYSRAIVKNELYTWKSSIADYDKAIEIAPDYFDAIVNRGAVKDENGDYKGALTDYEKALELKPNDAMTYFNIGNTKFNQGKESEALENWQKAKELGADYAQERINEKCK